MSLLDNRAVSFARMHPVTNRKLLPIRTTASGTGFFIRQVRHRIQGALHRHAHRAHRHHGRLRARRVGAVHGVAVAVDRAASISGIIYRFLINRERW